MDKFPGWAPGAPGASQLPIKKPSFLVFFIREFGSFTLRSRIPGTRSSNKTAEIRDLLFREFGSLEGAPGAQPGNLSTGYPQVIHTREFGEFELPKPMG